MIPTMGNFRTANNDRGGRDDRRSGGRFFGGRSGFGRNSDRQREMFRTVCSNCGRDCEVPFKPTSGKPVYCSDCFEKMGGRNSNSGRNDRPERRESPRADNSATVTSKQLNELNVKLDKIISLLTPKEEKILVKETITSVEEPAIEVEVKTPRIKKVKKS